MINSVLFLTCLITFCWLCGSVLSCILSIVYKLYCDHSDDLFKHLQDGNNQHVKWLFSLDIWLTNPLISVLYLSTLITFFVVPVEVWIYLQCDYDWPSWSRGAGPWGPAAPGPAWPSPGRAAWPGSTGTCGGGRSPGCCWTAWRAPPRSAGRSPAGSAAHTGTAAEGDRKARETLSWHEAFKG